MIDSLVVIALCLVIGLKGGNFNIFDRNFAISEKVVIKCPFIRQESYFLSFLVQKKPHMKNSGDVLKLRFGKF